MSKKISYLFLGTIIITFLLLVISVLNKPIIDYKYFKSMANLKQIGIALWMYADDHNNVFPDNLEQTVVYYGKSYLDILESPLKPMDFNEPSYIYISGHLFEDAESKEKYIIAYENPKYLSGYELEQVNVLYLEGYVERLKKEKFLSELQKTYEYLGKPMPEIKFKEYESKKRLNSKICNSIMLREKFMVFIYAVSALMYFAAMVFAFTWKHRPGKMLLCISLLLSSITSLISVTINIIVNTEFGRNIIQYVRFYSYFAGIVHMLSVILLLVFIIVARNHYVPRDNYNYENGL